MVTIEKWSCNPRNLFIFLPKIFLLPNNIQVNPEKAHPPYNTAVNNQIQIFQITGQDFSSNFNPLSSHQPAIGFWGIFKILFLRWPMELKKTCQNKCYTSSIHRKLFLATTYDFSWNQKFVVLILFYFGVEKLILRNF